jgi:hypothetical protein
MPYPFVNRKVVRLTVVQRLTRRGSLDAAIVEINNLFARSGVRAVGTADIEEILARNHLPSKDRHVRHFERFYREYLLFCLTDRRLSDDELADLAHLRSILAINPETVESIHRNIARQVYLRSVAEVLTDGTIDASERAFLARLRDQLGVPTSIAENIEEMKERQYRSRNQS